MIVSRPMDNSDQRRQREKAVQTTVPDARSQFKLGGNQGVLPSQAIEVLIARRNIRGKQDGEILKNQIQPASIDLRLAKKCYRVRASFLPGKFRTVEQHLKEFVAHELNLAGEGAVLERGCFYVAELQELLTLPESYNAAANPKSSTGRLDVFTRLISDNSEVFDWVEGGYDGPLFVEICPITFSIRAREGSRLNQLRFLRRTSGQHRYDRPAIDDKTLEKLHKKIGIVSEEKPSIRNGLNVRVQLAGSKRNEIVGYKALKRANVVDVDRVASHRAKDFWEPIRANSKGQLILEPSEFYILASKEKMQVPPEYAAEMAPVDPMMGEFRAHYAGFFDPGFGHMPNGQHGSRAVLEVRSHDVPFALEDGQFIARLIYERMTEKPDLIYGRDLKSNYQGQGLKLSKHFK